jgi:hypothetical protein
MPRNPDKTPCQVPGCHNWAMRGHTRCRSHRDRELGPRRGGAPPGNLNALKTGHQAHPASLSDLRDVARQVVLQPDRLPDCLHRLAASVHGRTRDPYRALVAFQALLSDLIPLVATDLFMAEARARLGRLPPERQRTVLSDLRRQTRRQSPGAALLSLRGLDIESEKSKKTSTGTDPSSASGTRPDAAPGDGG